MTGQETAIRVVLPHHLRTLAGTTKEVSVTVRPAAASGSVTLGQVLDSLEAEHPVLRGTVRDAATGRRRPFVRYFACEEDYSHEPPETVLPGPVAAGTEPLYVVGAMAGG